MVVTYREVLVITLVALIGAPLFAAEGDLLDDVERAAQRADAADTPRAPDFVASDIYGKEVGLRDYRGSAVVLTFLSPTCIKDAIGWLKAVQTSFLGDPGIAFVSVLFPGPTPAFSSRGANLKKIRERIEQFYTDAQERMPAEEKRCLERTEIRWIVDWRRDLHQSYDVEADRVHILLIDRSGKIEDRFSRRTPQTERRLGQMLDRYRSR